MKATVFLGGGRITSALLAGLRTANYGATLLVYDRHPQKLRQLRKLYGVATERNLRQALAQARILVIAVRPASLSDLLDDIGVLNRPAIAISLAAGVPLAKLQRRLGPPVVWARAMPSPACRNGRGLTALTFPPNFPPQGKREIKNLFAAVGQVVTIPERQFDAFTVTYSCSHGYHALAALAEAGESLGLNKQTAVIAAAHALADGVLHWKGGNLSIQNLLREAATPGGIAAAVLKSMDRSGYKKSLKQGLAAGFSRAKTNSKLI
jgi:pyrroline-5-carboxylate reductase